jgi:hypothetical protein
MLLTRWSNKDRKEIWNAFFDLYKRLDNCRCIFQNDITRTPKQMAILAQDLEARKQDLIQITTKIFSSIKVKESHENKSSNTL